MWRKLFVACLALAIPALADTAPDSTTIQGAVEHGGSWTVARLKAEPGIAFQSIEFLRHGQKHTADVVSLMAVMKAAGMKMYLKMGPAVPPTQKNYPLRLAIIVAGRDGYAATFSAAELLPDIGNHAAWLEIDEDGKPLSETNAPMSLLVPDDIKPARWVHGVGTITVLDATAAATQPSSPNAGGSN